MCQNVALCGNGFSHGNQHFCIFPQGFLTFKIEIHALNSSLLYVIHKCFQKSDKAKILSLD